MSVKHTARNGNMPFQLSVLNGLQRVSDNTNNVSGILMGILSSVKAHQDMEILLVRDTGAADLIVKQINEYDEETDTWSTAYQDISGAPYVPVGPLEYMDASAVLNLILAELLDQGTTLDSISTSNTSIDGKDFATQTTLAALLTELELKADLGETQPISAASLPLPTGASTEATLASVDTRLTPQVRTHNSVSSSGAGTVPAGSLRGSVINSGASPGTWNGISLPAGESIPWHPVGNRDTYAVINFDATGTTFLIEYTT